MKSKSSNIKSISKPKDVLYTDITSLIETNKEKVAYTINSTLAILYWKIGKRIQIEVLENQRAEYGKQIIQRLSKKLVAKYGNGWGEKQLRHCLRLVETLSENQIVYAVRRQLSWTHIRTISYLNDEVQRDFYLNMCTLENWSTRQLQERIDSMLFERTAISKKSKVVIKRELKSMREKNNLSPDMVFRDPYVLDFLGLKDTYSEQSLEDAILRELERFILELGQGFSFVERQKRMNIDGEDFRLDLLFYHRGLKRLVAIDLKLGKFKASYKSQMELYLRWLEKYEMQEDEKTPLGLILCAEGNKEQIELLELDKSGIKVAQYITGLPSKNILQRKLHKALMDSRHYLKEKSKKPATKALSRNNNTHKKQTGQ